LPWSRCCRPIIANTSAACLAQATESAFASPLKPFFDSIGHFRT
jgi:hypothetical protein